MKVHADPFLVTGRRRSLLESDWLERAPAIADLVTGASVLVAGGAGTIGVATVRALLPFKPARLHIVDIDENGLARLARALRAEGSFETRITFLAADIGGYPLTAHCSAEAPLDLALDFAAVKHVRSEKSVAALLHLLAVNVVRQERFFRMLAGSAGAPRSIAVSTDKAADPASFMGASKRLMEEVLHRAGKRHGFPTRTARFANVAFSSGSLLESFGERLAAGRPLAAPANTRRFFISAGEAAEICLLALAEDEADTVVPRLGAEHDQVDMAEAARRYLANAGYEAVMVDTLAEAETVLSRDRPPKRYPVVLTPLDTQGEKAEEVFIGEGERPFEIGLQMLQGVSVPHADAARLETVVRELADRVEGRLPTAAAGELADLIRQIVPNFVHHPAKERLDDRI
jgi:FlaA1/EpsC-like NDP-sugar epimerase